MPSLECDPASGRFRIRFRFGGAEYKRSLKVTTERDARALLGRVVETILLIERGRLDLPAGVDPAEFILSDGKVSAKPVVAKPITLGELLDRYETQFTAGAKEANTRANERVHFGHLRRLIGANTPVPGVTSGVIQRYVDARSVEQFRDKPIKPQTVRKEIGTLQSVLSWAAHREIVAATFSTRRVVFPKGCEKHPFRTYDEIAAVVARGGLTPQAERELWDGLFLTTAQTAEAVEYVRRHSPVAWLYPMVVAAAHTGARRSELLRARVEDFDFANRTVLVREKKKSKAKETFRVVDMTTFLAGVMKAYFAAKHPGGVFAFAAEANVEITDGVSQKALRRLLNRGKWKVLRGYHVFRHSFASNLAAAGVDQRVIDELMGHTTVEMQKRYRHLFPDQRRQAVLSVFGS